MAKHCPGTVPGGSLDMCVCRWKEAGSWKQVHQTERVFVTAHVRNDCGEWVSAFIHRRTAVRLNSSASVFQCFNTGWMCLQKCKNWNAVCVLGFCTSRKCFFLLAIPPVFANFITYKLNTRHRADVIASCVRSAVLSVQTANCSRFSPSLWTLELKYQADNSGQTSSVMVFRIYPPFLPPLHCLKYRLLVKILPLLLDYTYYQIFSVMS